MIVAWACTPTIAALGKWRYPGERFPSFVIVFCAALCDVCCLLLAVLSFAMHRRLVACLTGQASLRSFPERLSAVRRPRIAPMASSEPLPSKHGPCPFSCAARLGAFLRCRTGSDACVFIASYVPTSLYMVLSPVEKVGVTEFIRRGVLSLQRYHRL